MYSHYVIYTHIATLPAVVIELFDDLCDNYKIDRKRPHEEEWPPNQPSSIVNLALIHYKSTRTQQEVIEISKRCKEGASHVDKLTSSLHSTVTTDIKKLFIPEAFTEPPKCILIEGAPGIGKTVLSKEIAYQWANGELLQEHKLVFLMFLRDPRLHKIKSVEEILEHFTSENSCDLYKFVKKNRGKNVAFVFDGFDEYPVALQQNSFITNLIKGENDGRLFVNSTVVVTSRPTATLFLHRIVDRRIEILGFPKEERDKYISLSVRNSVDKFQEIDKYLKRHPIINNLCYIPLHLAILIYLFQQDNLPEILTEMNEYFIINTIYRYLERHNLTPPGVVKVLTDLPSSIVTFIYKLSQLAFTGLSNNQLVFTYEEIKKICPKMDNIPGAINGFGLLQAVQHYPKKGAGRTTSVNFLHFTMQEYLAALHVSTFSGKKQSSLMKKTFWDGQFNFMWIMYVGIVGVRSNTFASFLASNSNLRCNNVYNDKRKCLHLFQCYVEARSVAELPTAISSMFADGKITLSGITLLPHHISSLIFFMYSSSIQWWKVLKLDHCNLGEIGMNSLLEHVIKNDENISMLEYVDLSGNMSSPWGVYCAIIRQCCVNSLTLCGDEGMKEYVREIADSLQISTALQLLTLCASKRKFVNDQDMFEKASNNKSPEGILVVDGNQYFNTVVNDHRKIALNSNSRVVKVKVLYDGDCECLPETVNLPNIDINEDTLQLITFGLHNNTTIKKIDLSHNFITDNKAVIISNCLKHNSTIQKLDLSHSNISIAGMNIILSDSVKYAVPLEYVDLSGNKSSPWGVYCTIIRHCCVNSLTLCGDKGMKEYVKEITDSLQTNPTLQSLTLCKIGRIGVQSIKDVLDNNRTLKELNMSWKSKGTTIIHRKFTHDKFSTKFGLNSHEGVVDINILCDGNHECSSEVICMSYKGIDDDAVCLMTFGLYNNLTVKTLDLSRNKFTDDGVAFISDCFLKNCVLHTLILSRNSISYKGGNKISELICINKVIQKLDMSHNNICDDGAIAISESLKTNNTLQELNLSDNWITREGAKKIAETLLVNKGLYKLDVSCNGISDDGVLYISDSLRHNKTLRELNLSKNGITNKVVVIIAEAIWVNVALQKLDLSYNFISDDRMIVMISDALKNNNA